jgi:hypothetical protein
MLLNPSDIPPVCSNDPHFIELEKPGKVFLLSHLIQPNRLSIIHRMVAKYTSRANPKSSSHAARRLMFMAGSQSCSSVRILSDFAVATRLDS